MRSRGSSGSRCSPHLPDPPARGEGNLTRVIALRPAPYQGITVARRGGFSYDVKNGVSGEKTAFTDHAVSVKRISGTHGGFLHQVPGGQRRRRLPVPNRTRAGSSRPKLSAQSVFSRPLNPMCRASGGLGNSSGGSGACRQPRLSRIFPG